MVDEPQEMIPPKPSFFSSVRSGIGGFVKGALSGGLLGAISGALVGALVVGIGMVAGAVAVPVGGAMAIAAAVGGGALTGTVVGASAMGTVGAAAGTVTGVVKSREVGQPTAEDVVNVAKISFAQGVAVGHNIEHAAQVQQTTTKHADKITTERAAMAMAERQVIN